MDRRDVVEKAQRMMLLAGLGAGVVLNAAWIGVLGWAGFRFVDWLL